VGSNQDNDPQADYPTSRSHITDRSAAQLKVAVFGPNKTYLHHIRAVLPSLGERDAIETTFEEWVRGSGLDEELKVATLDDDLEQILDASVPREQRERLFRRARAKGSVEMGQVLTRYVSAVLARRLEAIHSQPVQIVAEIAARPVSFEVKLPNFDARERLANGMPLNRVRALIRQRMRMRLRRQVEQSLADQGSTRQVTRVLERFGSEFQRRWPRSNVATLYRDLLSDTEQLRAAAVGSDIRWQWLQGELSEFRLDDIAPLAYLKLLVDGPLPVRPPGDSDSVWTHLDHIVIDEAQDLSPLALVVLRAHADGLTVLGDMNQAIYAHRGTRSWSELRRGLGQEARQIRTLSVSYRSTQQIAELANCIVRAGGLDGGVCRPFPRKGSDPRLQRATDRTQMHELIIDFVSGVALDDSSTVAVLTRTAADARSLFDTIADRLGEASVCITDRLEYRDARILIMPAYLAKGIEFDGVVVVDVDKDTYANTMNDATLLYVGITRALHHLLLVWCGSPSPLIAAKV